LADGDDSMTHNCYWIEEDGVIELCAEAALPGLPSGWIRFDSQPTNGQIADTVYAPSVAPMQAKAAYGNGLIVMAAAFKWGVSDAVDGSHETYTTFVSDDDGFTYGLSNEPYAWRAGAGAAYGGYDAESWSGDRNEHYGTKISFDGSVFYIVNTTNNDINPDPWYVHETIVTRSADGVNWITTAQYPNGRSVMSSDSFNGDLWYVGGTRPADPWPDDHWAICHTDDHGATWTETQLPGGTDRNGESPDYTHDSAANADGLHIITMSYIPSPYFYGFIYHRPTSKTTYATGIQFFWSESGDPYVGVENANIIASRINTNFIMCSFIERTNDDEILVKRSLDGGLTWGANITAYAAPGDFYFRYQLFYVHHGSCQLDDGRVVIVVTVEGTHETVNDNHAFYVISYDEGATWGPPIHITGGILADAGWGQGRISVEARGNDFILSNGERATQYRNWIVRP
jgi:hypothetical protein